MLLSDRFLGFFMVPAQGSWNYNFMGQCLLSVLVGPFTELAVIDNTALSMLNLKHVVCIDIPTSMDDHCVPRSLIGLG